VDILRIGLQVARGLAAAHAQGLIHRDVKPANILLERGVDRVMLTDFGLARAADDASLTRSGVIAGTPQYMSPEQARGEPIDARSDLFSLGSVLYTMSAGRPPFRAETSYGILRRVTDDAPRPLRDINPDIPAWLESLVHRLHSKQAPDRYESADAVAELLEQCLAHIEQPAVAPLPDGLRPLTRNRRWLRPALIAIISAAILIAGWIATVPFLHETAAPPARQQADVTPADVVPAVPAAVDHDASAPPPPDAARWDDGLDAQLRAAAHDLDRLHEEVNQP
jgi:serine/threonine protein kinase